MKKLLNILSTLTLTTLTSLSIISCQQQNITFKIPFDQQENYVVQAINETQNKQLTTNFNPLTVNDILVNPIITNGNLNSKNDVVINYDIKIKQTANTFWNNNFVHRIPEVSGNFQLNLNNKLITNNRIIKITYSAGNYQNYINNIDNILTGSTNDFTLIMDPTSFGMFDDAIWDSRTDTKYLNNFLKQNKIYNPNIILTKHDWRNLLLYSDDWRTYEGYAVCLHVIKISEKDFLITYQNLTSQDDHNMPLPNKDEPWLPLFAFNSTKDWEDGSIITSNNKFIGLNKDSLQELNDIYTDNSNYHNLNWNIKAIIQFLKTNHFCNTNLDLKTIATCLFNNWNINLVNNFLASNHEYFLMQYDANNSYVKNNWNM